MKKIQSDPVPAPTLEPPTPENPMTDMLREGGAHRDRSFAAVATSATLHLSLAGVVIFASAFAVGPPPARRTVPVVFVAPQLGPPPPPAPLGVQRPREKEPVKQVKHDVPKQPTTVPKLVAPSEPEEIVEAPIGIPDGHADGVVGGVADGESGGELDGTPGGIPGALLLGPPAEPETVVSSFEQARLISKVEPLYPAIGRKSGAHGVVVLEAIIDTDGTVVEVNVLRSIPVLDAAAVTAVRQWRFEPGVRNGRPVRQRLTVSVNFTLHR